MKKIIILLLICLFPLIRVDAISCLKTSYEEPFKIQDGNFSCSGVEGDILTFFQNESDLKDYFEYTIDSDRVATIKVSNTLKFDSALKSGLLKINNGSYLLLLYT